MAEVITVPKMTANMVGATIKKWYVKVGDQVMHGNLLAEIKTTDFTVELESYEEGVVLYISPITQRPIPINGLLLIIGEPHEDIQPLLELFHPETHAVIQPDLGPFKAAEIEMMLNFYKPSPLPTAEYFIMPPIREDITQVNIVKLLVKVGEDIIVNDPILEIEVEGVIFSLSSVDIGKVLYLAVEEGKTVAINGLIAIIGDPVTDLDKMLSKFGNAPLLPLKDKYMLPRLPSGEFPSYSDCHAILMPQFSTTFKKGIVTKWLVKKGQEIEQDDVLAEVEVDKATMELTVYEKGTVRYLAPTNRPIPPDGLIAIIGSPSADIQPLLQHFQAWEASLEVTQSKGGCLMFFKDLLPPYR